MSRIWSSTHQGNGKYDLIWGGVSVLCAVVFITVLADRALLRMAGGPSVNYPRVQLDSPAFVVDHPEKFRYILNQERSTHPGVFTIDLCPDWADPEWPLGATLTVLVYQQHETCKSIRPPYAGYILERDSHGNPTIRTNPSGR